MGVRAVDRNVVRPFTVIVRRRAGRMEVGVRVDMGMRMHVDLGVLETAIAKQDGTVR